MLSEVGVVGDGYGMVSRHQRHTAAIRTLLSSQVHQLVGRSSIVWIALAVVAVLEDYAQAIEYYEQRLDVARAIPDQRVEAQALGSLRVAYYALGDYAKVIQYHEQGLAMRNR